MSQFIEEYYEIKLRPQFLKQLDEEPLHKIDKYFILNQTQTFNHSKFSDEYSRMILIQLIYLVNQGIQFNEQEVEQLCFRITKLFQSNSSRLRVITYQSLKMIMPQKYVHIIIQCLTKDLQSQNSSIKLQALKFIPYIENEQYIYQVERFVHDALIDTNLQIQSQALIVGIHLVNKFPNLVGKWLFEVVQSLDQRKENLQYHALILLHEIKKQNLAQFIKIIILMTKKFTPPFVGLQIIKFTKEILPYTKNPHEQELITHLFQQVESLDPLIIFESSKILSYDQNISNDKLVPINQFMEDHMHPLTDSVLLYTSLRFLLNLMNFENRKQLLTTQQISQIYILAFNTKISISSLAILIAIKLDSKNVALQLKKVYDTNIDIKSKEYFLQGLREMIKFNHQYNEMVLEFFKISNLRQSQYQLLEIVIQIIDDSLNDSKQNLNDLYETLILLTQYRGFEFQKNAIKIMNKVFLNTQSRAMSFNENKLWQKYLQDNNISSIDENSFNFVTKQYNFIKQYVYEYFVKKQYIEIDEDTSQNKPYSNQTNNTCNQNE